MTTRTITRPFDAARYLATREGQAEYLSAMMEGNDPAMIRHALATVARARGMADLARDAGLGSKSLYKTLGEGGNPELGTVLKMLGALGLTFSVQVSGSQVVGARHPAEGDATGDEPAPARRARAPRTKGTPPAAANAPAVPEGPETHRRAGRA